MVTDDAQQEIWAPRRSWITSWLRVEERKVIFCRIRHLKNGILLPERPGGCQIRQHSRFAAIWHLITQLLIRASLSVHPRFTPARSRNYLVSAFDSVLFNPPMVGIAAAHRCLHGSVGCGFLIKLKKHLTSPQRFGITSSCLCRTPNERPCPQPMWHGQTCLHSSMLSAGGSTVYFFGMITI